MIDIRIDSNFKQLSRTLDRLQKDLSDKAAVMALNKTAAKAKVEMKRAISSEFNVTQRDVIAKLKLLKAKKGHLQAEINPFASSNRSKRSQNIIRFMENKVTLAEGRRRRKSGTLNVLRFKIKRHGPVKTIRGAFVATANGGTAIFRRVGKSRYPIEAVQTVDVPSMFNTKKINKRVRAKIRKDFPIEFERAAAQVIRRFNAR